MLVKCTKSHATAVFEKLGDIVFSVYMRVLVEVEGCMIILQSF